MAFNWTPNENETFSAAMNADGHGLSAAAKFRRKEMCEAWEAVDKSRSELETRMAEVGIVEPSTPQHGVLRLNVGGSRVHISHSILRGEIEEGSRLSRLSELFETIWDDRIPRDSERYIVVDESPVCVKFLIHELLKRSGTAMGMADFPVGDNLPSDETAYMPNVRRVLGLTESKLADDSAVELLSDTAVSMEPPSHVHCYGMEVVGGSSILTDLRRETAKIRESCPGKPTRMELLYRASRDGWTGEDFHSRCGNNSPSTIALFRVRSSARYHTRTRGSVVGGFSSVSWSCENANGMHKPSPGACVFIVKENDSPSVCISNRPRCTVKEGCEDRAVYLHPNLGPTFGFKDSLASVFSARTGSTNDIFKVDSDTYYIPSGTPISNLNGRPLVEVEVFRVCATGTATVPPPPPSTTIKPKANIVRGGLINLPAPETTAVSAERYNSDIRSFGVVIADSLMEERIALHQAHVELALANAKGAASMNALFAVYGPHVGTNEEGAAAVVELSVRGTRMTTLRSTLQICPESAFTARFGEHMFSAFEKDIDEHGRRVINDCSPAVFSKILDVLRVRKRAAWATGGTRGGSDVRVVIKDADRDSFEEFVHMYFTDHENFIMDLVQTPDDASKNGNSASGGRQAPSLAGKEHGDDDISVISYSVPSSAPSFVSSPLTAASNPLFLPPFLPTLNLVDRDNAVLRSRARLLIGRNDLAHRSSKW